jgi:antitoxin (DNA-binding transcriptional repressor) of toxin-antitoxin stability system
MKTVTILEAADSLCRLVQSVEDGREREILIARDGQPVARLVPIESVPTHRRIGIAKGRFEIGERIDAHDDVISEQFLAGAPSRSSC